MTDAVQPVGIINLFCMLMLPFLVFGLDRASPRQLRRWGLGLTLLGLISLAAIAVWQAATWIPSVPRGEPVYFVQRYLFQVATLIDVPVVCVAGLTALLAARIKRGP